jgi:CheY-like chemotaxis protein
MGGQIVVESRSGMGSRFSIHLRLPRAAPAALAPAPISPPPPRRVLLVDPMAASRQAVRDLVAHLLPAGGRVQAVDGLIAVPPALRAAQQADEAFHWLLVDDALTDGLSPMFLASLRGTNPGLQIVALRSAANSGLAGLPALDKPVLPAPLRALLADEWDMAASTGRAWGTDNGQRPAARLAGLRVLLVEDNALNRQLAQELLSFEGALVRSAENGLEALERLHTDGAGAYDVVLMDLQMPVMDGYEAVRRLRQMPSLDAVPVLAMTAHAMAGDRERCLALGMQGHIAKPVDADALVALLQGHLPPPKAALRSG